MHLSAAFVLLLLGLVYAQAEESSHKLEESLSKIEESLEKVDQPDEDLEETERSKKHAYYGGYPFYPSAHHYGLPSQNLGLSSWLYPGLQSALNVQAALPAWQALNLYQGLAPFLPPSTVITEQVQPVAAAVNVVQPAAIVEEVVQPVVPVAPAGINYAALGLEDIYHPALRPFGYPYIGAPDWVNYNRLGALYNDQFIHGHRPAVYTDVDVVAPAVGLPQYNYVV